MKILKASLPNLAFLVGLALLVYGAWLIYHPAGFIVGGGFIMILSVLTVIFGDRYPRP